MATTACLSAACLGHAINATFSSNGAFKLLSVASRDGVGVAWLAVGATMEVNGGAWLYRYPLWILVDLR